MEIHDTKKMLKKKKQDMTKDELILETGIIFWSSLYVACCKAAVDKWGDEGVEVMRKAVHDRTLNVFKDWERREIFKPQYGDCRDIPHAISILGTPMEAGCEAQATVPECSENLCVIDNPTCALAPMMNEVWPDICKVISVGGDDGYCHAINPNMYTTSEASLARGDKRCLYRYEIKK